MRPFLRLLAPALLAFTMAAAAAEPLPAYNVDRKQISVSGISSGGYMAQQLHTAYSELFMGAGIIAGGPFYCAETLLVLALTRCMKPDALNKPDPARLARLTRDFAAAGKLDPVSGLAGDQVWIFSSPGDTTVYQAVSDALEQYYRHFVPAAQIRYVKDVGGAHAMPTDDFGYACDYLGASSNPDDHFINDCDYDAAGELLKHIYRRMKAPSATLSGRFVKFPQNEFIASPRSHGMAEYGYAYVPKACENGRCKLHVALHGCLQSAERIGETFVRHAGYNEWADANKMIVLYPQATASLHEGNGNGCWDWWGYDDADYYNKRGRQMQAVRGMIERVSAASDDAGSLTPPGGLHLVSQGQGWATLGWTGSPSAAGYLVYHSLIAGGPYLQVNAQLVLDTQFTAQNLAPGTHYFIVVAVDASGMESGPSNELAVSVPGL